MDRNIAANIVEFPAALTNRPSGSGTSLKVSDIRMSAWPSQLAQTRTGKMSATRPSVPSTSRNGRAIGSGRS